MLLGVFLPGCGGSGGIPADSSRVPSTAARVATGGGGDALAAALLLLTDLMPEQPLWRTVRVDAPSDPRFHALAHLQVTALATGAGADLAGSARIRRLAAATDAPPDRDGDGSNLRETLEAELQRLADAAGWPGFDGAAPVLFPWRQATANVARHVERADPARFGAWRTERGPGVGSFDLEHVGHALLARAIAGAGLLLGRRGIEVGATAADGMLAVALTQQALAIDETLLRSLFFDGAGFVPVRPNELEATSPAWTLVRRASAVLAQGPTSLPVGYSVVDPASDLAATAAVLRGAAQLAWNVASTNPRPELVEAFRGTPFSVEVAAEPDPIPDRINFVEDVAPILQARCTGCHGGPFPESGLNLESFEGLQAGGFSGSQLVVAGDHAQSPLWLVVDGSWIRDGQPVPRMPFQEAPLAPEQIDTIAAWIDAGAHRDPAVLPPASDVGRGLARVLVHKIRRSHLVPTTSGALLHHRHSRTGAGALALDDPSGIADPRATGLALQGLAQFELASPIDENTSDLLAAITAGAIEHLCTESGTVVRAFDIDGAMPFDGVADVAGHAALTAGLMVAGRVLDSAKTLARARLLGASLIRDYADDAGRIWLERPGERGARIDAITAMHILDALRELAADGAVAGARSALEVFVATVLPEFAASEWAGGGEVLGDAIADSDGDGIVEPNSTDGDHAIAPAFVAEVALGELDGARTVPATWSDHVQPLFRAKCVGCHVAGASAGDLRVDSPGWIERGGSSGRALIVAGDPAASALWQKLALRPAPYGDQMPLGRTPFDARSLERIESWIRHGARQW